MSGNRWLKLGVYLAATAVLAAGTVVLVKDRRGGGRAEATSAADLPELAPMPFPATLSLDGSTIGTVGSQFSASATSFSENPAAHVELYDGSRKVASVKPEPGSPSANVVYPALSVGPHALHAVVTDSKGRVSRSPATVVNVNVGLPEGAIVALDPQGNKVPLPPPPAGVEPVVSVPVTPLPKETVVQAAKRLAVDPAQIGVVVPDDPEFESTAVGRNRVLPAGARLLVSVAPNAGMEELEAKSALIKNPVGEAKGDLALTGTADGCDVILTSKGGTGKVFYFDGNSGVPGWASIGETNGDGDLRLTAPTTGAHVYFARTDKASTQAVSVNVPLSCAGDLGWTGDARIVDGQLYLPPKAWGNVYLYLQVDGKTGVHIPEDNGLNRSFRAGGVTPIQALIPDLSTLAGSSAELSVWKAGEFPAEVARGSLKVPEGRTLVEIVGEPGIINLSIDDPKKVVDSSNSPTHVNLDHGDKKLNLRWDAASDRVDEVLWQVLSKPPGNTAPASSTVLAAGISTANTADDGSGKQGSFTLDTADIPGHGTAKPTGPKPRLPGQLTLVSSAVTPFTLLSLVEPKTVAPLPADAPLNGSTQGLVELPEPGAETWVQVIANPKAAAMGTSSNTVSVKLPPLESATTGVHMKIDEFTLDPGRAPQADLVGCAEVTLGPAYGVAYPSKDVRNAAHQVYRNGDGVYCYVPPPPKAEEDCFAADYLPGGGLICDAQDLYDQIEGEVIEGLKSLYGVVSNGYNGAINGLVKLSSKFNPICIAAKEVAESAAAACKELTEAVARAVIESVLASFGLPPQLPSLAELEAIANGELAALGVALMKQAGVPCDSFKASPEVQAAADISGAKVEGYDVATVVADPCLAVANALLKQAKKAVTKDVSTTMASATGLQDFSNVNSQFSIKPIKATLPVPMQVRLTLSPVDPAVDAIGLTCEIGLLPSDSFRGAVPGPFNSTASLLLTEEAPIDGKGRFSGSAALSDYRVPFKGSVGATPLSTRLKDDDVTISIEQPKFTKCLDAKGSVSGRVRPPD